MAGNIGHKVVVDINLTSLDVKDDGDEEDMTDEDELLTDDDENEDDVHEEIPLSLTGGKYSGREQSRVQLTARPARERKQKQQFNWANFNWTYKEKQQLLGALKKYPPSAVDLIHAEVSTKTKLQIKDYLNKIHKSIQWKSDNPMPIVDWINMGRDLVRTEKKDYTDSLQRAMSIISSFEDHPKPAKRVPDYKAIYRYLALVLEGKELPLLGPLESAVVLDLLHGVVNKIAVSETSRQRQVMKWKYKLLSGKVDTSNSLPFIKQARKALSNDFTDFEGQSSSNINKVGRDVNTETSPGNVPSSSSQLPANTRTEASKKTNTSKLPEKTTTSNKPATISSESSAVVNSRKSLVVCETAGTSQNTEKSDNPSSVVHQQEGLPKTQHKQNRFELSSLRTENDITVDRNMYVTVDKTDEGNKSIDMGKLQGKRRIVENIQQKDDRALIQEEDCPPVKRQRGDVNNINLCPQPDLQVVTVDTGGKITNSKQTGRSTSSEGQNSTASEGSQSSSAHENGPQAPKDQSHSTGKKRRLVGRPPKGMIKTEDEGDSSQTKDKWHWRRPGRLVGSKKVYPERQEKAPEDPSEIPKKPSLYTLNPFCVPVSLLPLHNKSISLPVQTVTLKKQIPAIIPKKHSPMFNKRKNDGVTSVSIHRMAAVIPVSKQHVLLPNAASQKSQS
ncbi:uncharacterized protein LOC132552915 [Ylistrum balloti]|uniref:uncharacterized protein LOC132552915 n=1 Tax=Ylistrum balloti TaxID=509963 RepID=UPI0029058363|nr:uncharacterized protein LOC132552915 [Ylistrum balloti]XP_060073098.1 uncharacterized protein LOC132552915 [Ylistrum balloti]